MGLNELHFFCRCCESLEFLFNLNTYKRSGFFAKIKTYKHLGFGSLDTTY